jgi:cell division protein FtsL
MDYRALFLKSSLTFIFIAAFCFPIIWIHASITNLELERGRLLKKIELEDQLLQERKIEFARLSDPARIRSIAASRLKMKDPEKVVYIFFGPKGIKSAAVALSQLGEVFNSTEVASKMR